MASEAEAIEAAILLVPKPAELNLGDGRSVFVYENGDRVWMKNEKLHREDGPALEFQDGIRKWYLNGKKHRKDGPAVEYADGTCEWWINGQRVEK
jgi:hypothetical protein